MSKLGVKGSREATRCESQWGALAFGVWGRQMKTRHECTICTVGDNEHDGSGKSFINVVLRLVADRHYRMKHRFPLTTDCARVEASAQASSTNFQGRSGPNSGMAWLCGKVTR